MRVSLGTKLSLAFAALAAVSVVVVVGVLVAAGTIARDLGLAVAERLPASLASEQAQSSLLRMQLHVRGYLVAGDAREIEHYEHERKDFERHLQHLQALSGSWSSSDALDVSQLAQEYASWAAWPPRLFELHNNPIANRAPLRLARFELQPRKVEVLQLVERLAALLRERGSGTSREALADLTAFQGSFDSMATNLLAYAASGEINFKSAYGPLMSINASQWQTLMARAPSLGAPDVALLDAIDRRRAEIDGLAQQIAEQWSGERPYEDLYLYRTQAEPQGQRIQAFLASLTTRQQQALQTDLGHARNRLESAALPALLAGGSAIALAFALVAYARRRIVAPVRYLGTIAEQVAAGDVPAPAGLDSSDEIERLAQTLHTRLRKDDMQRMLESISDALWSAVVDPEGRIAYRYFSAGIERIAGRPPMHFLETPRQWLEHLHAADRAAHDERLARIVAGASDREDAEYRIVHADGSLRWLRDNIRVVRSADGGVALHGVLSDITERKAAERALRESEGRFRSLTELSSDWFWRQDEYLRFTYLSPEVLDLAGDSAHSSLGKTRWELPGVTLTTGTWEEHRAVLEAHQPFRELEYFRIGHDGQRRYISVSGAPIFDEGGHFVGYQGIGRNITDRKRIEQNLRRSEERFALAVAGSNDGIWDWDLATGQLFMSERALQIYGIASTEPVRTFQAWWALVKIHPEDEARRREMQAKVIDGKLAAYDCEWRARHPDGSWRWLRSRGLSVRDEQGRATRMVGSVSDIDAQRRAETHLRQAQRLEALGTLAGGIAHDFNNILGAILGYGEVVQREAPRGSRLRRALDSIIAAGERGRALVERILTFSRSGAAGERRRVHVEAVVRETLELVGTKVPPAVAIKTRLDAGHAAVSGDATEVHQVVMNLVTNAFHAMPDGGVLSIELDTRSFETDHVASTGKIGPGEYIALSVRDTGVGIGKDVVERIFDPFFTTKEVGVGTGLGLSLAHGIATGAGGAIDVDSRVGQGSTFTVYLPRAGDADDVVLEWAPDLPRGSGQRVLVVDDEPPLVTLTVENLQALGYQAVGYASSLAALEAFRAEPQRFDAVVTDERMPGLAGIALIHELRALRPELPIVLASGYAVGDVVHRAVEAGADDVLSKPLLRQELALSLARVLPSQRPRVN